MKTKLMFVLMAFSIVVWAGAGLAADGPTASSGAGAGGDYISSPTLDIQLWCQEPDPAGSGLSSQIDAGYPFESWVADDYTSNSDFAIEKIVWWGVFFNVPDVIMMPTSFVISIYADTGLCNPGMDGGVPTTPIAQRTVVAYDVSDDGAGLFQFTADLTGDEILQDAGVSYWISIQAVMLFDEAGQFGWQSGLPQQLCTAVNLFPLLGTIEWTDTLVDMAFCLYASDDPIAVEADNWGSVKALFR